MKRCDDKDIKLKYEKCIVRASEMPFHGHLFTTQGLKPDLTKIEALRDMPAPTDVAGVLRFCGLAQYLARFLPNLSDMATPLRELTHKGAKWSWTDKHENCFNEIKKLACEAPILAHYDPNAPLTLQTDASSYGLGAVMIQNGRPVAYASRVLSPSERNWAQIEKECLSIVFGLERFDQYTCGRHVTVENDHKPLETLLQKPLSQSPKRIQAMRISINHYSPDMIYKPGQSMVLPDALSRAYPELTSNGESYGNFDRVNSLTCLPVTDGRINEIRQATESDKSLQDLITIIHEGWPESANKLPENLKPYYSVRDSLSYQDGVILKGERLVIPISLRSDIKKKIHSAHLGKDSMMRRAREIVYWPGMNAELQQLAESCDICLNMAPRQNKEPLMPRDRGAGPWKIVGCDLFEIDGRNYMVTADYYSNFYELDFMPSKTVKTIVLSLKRHFARYGIPEELVSDCSPFDSDEFKAFAADWGFVFNPSSPGFSQSNGQAETSVKSAKKLIKKCAQAKTCPYKALLELRNTPMQVINLSPAQILMQRRTRSIMPSTPQMLKPRLADPRRANEQRTLIQKKHYDKNSKPLGKLYPGQPVVFDKFDSTKRKPVWEKGVVRDTSRFTAPRRYGIEAESGHVFDRNRIHARPDLSASQPPQSNSEQNTPDGPSNNNPEPPTQALEAIPEAPHDLAPTPAVFSPRPTRSTAGIKPARYNDYQCD